jgi:hypothetical protein
MQKLPLGLKYEAKEQRHKITQAAHFLNHLPIQDDYKALFLSTYRVRGWQSLIGYKEELIDISHYGCDVTKLFLESKLIGLSTLHKIVMNADEAKRAEIYRLIKDGGLKPNRKEIEKLLISDAAPTLFDDS